MGMLKFLKRDRDEEFDDDELDLELDDELDDDEYDEDLDDEDFEENEGKEKLSLRERLSGFGKNRKEEIEDIEDEITEDDDDDDFDAYIPSSGPFSYDYKTKLAKQTDEAYANLRERTAAALADIRQIAGQSPIAIDDEDMPETVEELEYFDDEDDE